MNEQRSIGSNTFSSRACMYCFRSTLRIPRLVSGTAIALILFSFVALQAAQDVVIYSTGEDSPNRTEVRAFGEILDYTGSQIRIRLASGREQAIPTSRVIRIQTLWTPQQTLGDTRYLEGNYAAAMQQYNEALRIENRSWAQREILAQQVWCQRSLGRLDQAASFFLKLAELDPATQHFDAIPLVWTPYQPPAPITQSAVAWLDNRSDPLKTLLASSWLLSSAHRGKAIQALTALTSHTDPRIVHLAESQRWRTQLVTATPADLARWERQMDRMPASLRAGPYLLIGQGLARQKQFERAALLLMRVPIFYSQHRSTSAHALHAAGRALENLGRAEEAVGLYQEVVRDYSDVSVATDSSIRLKGLTEGATN